MADYDKGDSQIKTGIMAREAAAELSEAYVAIAAAIEVAYDDTDELRDIAARILEMRDRYRATGEAL